MNQEYHLVGNPKLKRRNIIFLKQKLKILF